MKRYNGDTRNTAYPKLCLINVGPGPVPLCVKCKSVVDKTYFKPGVSLIQQVDQGSRTPLYDSDERGNMIDYGLNIAWLRSKARDRVDIDLALKVVQDSIDRSKEVDQEKLSDLEKRQEMLKNIKEVTKETAKELEAEKKQSDLSTATN